jgi:hypothetical protein
MAATPAPWASLIDRSVLSLTRVPVCRPHARVRTHADRSPLPLPLCLSLSLAISGCAARAVLPGDVLAALAPDAHVKIGPGVRQDGGQLVATKAGTVRTRGGTTVWVENAQRRVRPPSLSLSLSLRDCC